MRSLSPAAVLQALAINSDDVFLHLVEINHSSLAQPFRFVADNVDVEADSIVYSAVQFELALLDERPDEFPRPTAILDNTDLSIITALRQMLPQQGLPTVTHTVVLRSQPTVVEYGPVEYKIRDVSGDADTISASMVLAAIEFEQWPLHTINPTNSPGAYGLNS